VDGRLFQTCEIDVLRFEIQICHVRHDNSLAVQNAQPLNDDSGLVRQALNGDRLSSLRFEKRAELKNEQNADEAYFIRQAFYHQYIP
jgi:hypothetical protein